MYELYFLACHKNEHWPYQQQVFMHVDAKQQVV